MTSCVLPNRPQATEQHRAQWTAVVVSIAIGLSTAATAAERVVNAADFGFDRQNATKALQSIAVTAVTHGMADCADRAAAQPELPLKLDGRPPQERQMRIHVKIPKHAARAVVVITAYDADTSQEGQLEINGRGSIPLFGKQGRSANDGKLAQFRFPTELRWWQDGANTLTWKHLSSGGFRIDRVRVEFLRDLSGN